MRHVRLHQVSRSKSRAKRQLTGEDAGGDDFGELTRVRARFGHVCATHAEEVEHGCLGLENGAAADGADFD